MAGIFRKVVRNPMPVILESPLLDLRRMHRAGDQSLRVHGSEDAPTASNQIVQLPGDEFELGSPQRDALALPVPEERRLTLNAGTEVQVAPVRIDRRGRPRGKAQPGSVGPVRRYGPQST